MQVFSYGHNKDCIVRMGRYINEGIGFGRSSGQGGPRKTCYCFGDGCGTGSGIGHGRAFIPRIKRYSSCGLGDGTGGYPSTMTHQI